ncbi:MAG: hypothetical protein OEQ39_29225 [Gammaproteobacteria bacterium]|nr:hypothetical protein [Gammaproteobacteria bacterium]
MSKYAHEQLRLTGLKNLPPGVNERRIYEARIVIQLDAGQAIYSERVKHLYFCDSPTKSISDAITSVFAGLKRPSKIEPVLIDELKFIAVGKKIALDDDELVAVCAALRLIGVEVTRGGSDILKRAGR